MEFCRMFLAFDENSSTLYTYYDFSDTTSYAFYDLAHFKMAKWWFLAKMIEIIQIH